MTSQTSLDPEAIATIGSVAPRTVSKWFDTGRLKGSRIPRGAVRRIPTEVLREFMKSHGMPLGDLEPMEDQIPETLSPFVVGEPVVLALDATIVAQMVEKLLLGELVQPISVSKTTTTDIGPGTAFVILFESGAMGSVTVQPGQHPQTMEFPDPLELIDPLRDEPLEGAYLVTLIELVRPEDRVHAA